VATTTAACQGVWIARLLDEIKDEDAKAMMLNVDNKSAISLCKNPVFHERSKHIEIRYHFIWQCVDDGKVQIEFCQVWRTARCAYQGTWAWKTSGTASKDRHGGAC
jgi:hypothetical protein